MNKNSVIGVVAIVLVIVALVFGGWVVDQNRRAAQAAEKVEEFSIRCDSAPADFEADFKSANASWRETIVAYEQSHYLGELLTPYDTTLEVIQVVVCSRVRDLSDRLENGEDRVAIYNQAEADLGQLENLVFATSNEWANAQSALGWLETAETWQVEAYYRYDNAPWDAVDLYAAYDEIGNGDFSLQVGWDAMVWSDWSLANLSGGYATGWYQLAIEHSSSPTPTPEPTNTPEPTDTPEPYVPPPTSTDWSTSSVQSGSTTDNSSVNSTGGYTDSGVFDDPSTDSGAFDEPEVPVNTDSGSWKVAPTSEPRRK